MIKKFFEKKKRRKNTQNLKYQTSLEQNLAKSEKITDLQDTIIRLQNENIKQKEELLQLANLRIERLSTNAKRNKQKVK